MLEVEMFEIHMGLEWVKGQCRTPSEFHFCHQYTFLKCSSDLYICISVYFLNTIWYLGIRFETKQNYHPYFTDRETEAAYQVSYSRNIGTY